MGHKGITVKCRVCRKEFEHHGVNNYLDPKTGEVYVLCDEHLTQAMEVDCEGTSKQASTIE